MPEIGPRDEPVSQEEEAGATTTESKSSQEPKEKTKPVDKTPEPSRSPLPTPPHNKQTTKNRKGAVTTVEAAGADSSTPSTNTKAQVQSSAVQAFQTNPDDLDPDAVNVPPNVLAAFRTPLRHKPTHGIPVASLQMRSYSVRNLELYADFAVRAAYWLGLPCSGPVPLPKKIERWTVLKSPFIFKKGQENFERITRKRLLTIYDGDPSVVEIWLAFLRKWQFYGVGMKANVWQFESLDVAGSMDKQFADVEKELDEKLRLFGFSKAAAGNRDLLRMMQKQGVRGPGVPLTDVRDSTRDPEVQTSFT